MTKETSDANGSVRQQNAPSLPPPNVQWIGPSSDPVLARIEGPLSGQVWLVTKPTVVIGRQSTSQPPDISILTNNYVSRAHLVMERVTTDIETGSWQLTCNGKNGVFLDGQIMKKTDNDRRPIALPHKCTLRFPSTELTYDLHILHAPPPDGASPSINKSTTSVGDSQDSGFVSPSKEETEFDDKPNYSYAQLIAQAISASPERKCTLSAIYGFISSNYSFFRVAENGNNCGWQNSVRHNLSLNRQFVRLPKDPSQAANKGAHWKFADHNEEEYMGHVSLAFTIKRGCGAVQATKARVPQQQNGQLTQQGGNAGVANGSTSSQLPMSPTDNRITSYGAVESQPVANPLPTPILNCNKKDESSLGNATQSAPSSPGFIAAMQARLTNPVQEAQYRSTVDNVAQSITNRQHNASGGSHSSSGAGTRLNTPIQKVGGATFKVSSSTKDGRNRLQLCHTPPEYVAVTIPGQSALGQLSYRHRGHKGNVDSQKALLQQYRGGSKSLSTTPVRDLLTHSLAKELLSPQQSTSAPKCRKRRAESGSGKHNAKFPMEAKSASTMSSPTFGKSSTINLEHLANVANTARLVELARECDSETQARHRELQRQINMLVHPTSAQDSALVNGGTISQSSNNGSLTQSVSANILQPNVIAFNGIGQPASSSSSQNIQQILMQLIANAHASSTANGSGDVPK